MADGLGRHSPPEIATPPAFAAHSTNPTLPTFVEPTSLAPNHVFRALEMNEAGADNMVGARFSKLVWPLARPFEISSC